MCYQTQTATNEENMKTITCALGIFLLLALTSTSLVSSNNQPSFKTQDDFTLTKVAEGVYGGIAKPGGLASGNAGFVVGDEGVLVVDTFFTPVAVEELIDAIGVETKQPIKYAVNTHYHLDHTGGNQVFAGLSIPIIGHDNLIAWQTTKNRRFLPASDELQKRRADAVKQLSETPGRSGRQASTTRKIDQALRCVADDQVNKSNRHLLERYSSLASWATRGCSIHFTRAHGR
jgi:hypothetical protein